MVRSPLARIDVAFGLNVHGSSAIPGLHSQMVVVAGTRVVAATGLLDHDASTTIATASAAAAANAVRAHPFRKVRPCLGFSRDRQLGCITV